MRKPKKIKINNATENINQQAEQPIMENQPDPFLVGQTQGYIPQYGTGREEQFREQTLRNVKYQSARTIEAEDNWINKLFDVKEENAQEFGTPFSFSEKLKYKNLREAKDSNLFYNIYRNVEEGRKNINVFYKFFGLEEDKYGLFEGFRKLDDDNFFKKRYEDDVTRRGDPENAITRKEIEDDPELQFQGWEKSFKQEQNLNMQMWLKRKEIAEERYLAQRVGEKGSGMDTVSNFIQLAGLDIAGNFPVYTATAFAGSLAKGGIAKTFALFGIENAIQGEIVSVFENDRLELEGFQKTSEQKLMQVAVDFGAGGLLGSFGKILKAIDPRKKTKITPTEMSDAIIDGMNSMEKFNDIMNLEQPRNKQFLASNEFRNIQDGNIEVMPKQFNFEGIKENIDIDYKVVDLSDIKIKEDFNGKVVDDIVFNIKPEMLLDGKSFQEGIIIVDKDYNIIVGNNRAKALEILYTVGDNETYMNALSNKFPQHDPLKFENPIMIRQIKNDLSPEEIKKLSKENNLPINNKTFYDTPAGKEFLAEEKLLDGYDKTQRIYESIDNLPDIKNIAELEKVSENFTPELKQEFNDSVDLIQQIQSFVDCMFQINK